MCDRTLLQSTFLLGLILLLTLLIQVGKSISDECTVDNEALTEGCISANSTHLNLFVDWLKDNGAIITNSVEWPYKFVNSDTNKSRNGVRFRETVQIKKVLAKIPQKVIIAASADLDSECDVVKEELAKILDPENSMFTRFRMADLKLALTLLKEHQKADESFYHPYIALLPRNEELTKLEEWSPAQLSEFDHAVIHGLAKQMKSNLRKVYEILLKKNIVNCPFDSFEWAFQIVRSRGIPFGSQVLLVPFLDQFGKTSLSSFNVGVDVRADGVELVSGSKASTEGSEALVYHGPFSNLFLLLNEGFVPLNNTDDGYPIALKGYSEEDPLFDRKQVIWDSREDATGNVVLLTRDQPPEELIAFFRIFAAMDEDQLTEEWLNRPFHPAEEGMALTGCLKQIEQELKQQKTSLDNDLKALEQSKVRWTPEKLLALQYRVSRKQILALNKCYCEQLLVANEKIGDRASSPEEYFDLFNLSKATIKDTCFERGPQRKKTKTPKPTDYIRKDSTPTRVPSAVKV
jgi:hypothetical protein